MDEIHTKVIYVLAESTGCEAGEIDVSDSLVDDLDVEPNMIDLFAELESEFLIEIEDDARHGIETVEDLIEFIRAEAE